MPTRDTGSKWLIGILTTLIVGLVLAGWSDLGGRVSKAATTIEEHMTLPGHPATIARLNAIDQQLSDIKQSLGDVHRDIKILLQQAALAKGAPK